MYVVHQQHVQRTSTGAGCQGVQCSGRIKFMAYPSKTDRSAILAAAAEQLAAGGLHGMSLRSLAAQLGIAPNALYRYFEDRGALEAALSAEGARSLLAALQQAAGELPPDDAVRAMAEAYLRFAREQANLYEVMMMRCKLAPEDAESHLQLWLFVVGQVSKLAGERWAREAAVSLWAFLRGMAALETAQVFNDEKPFSSFEFGLNAWLVAASQKSEPTSTV